VEKIVALKKLGLSLSEIDGMLRSRRTRENYGLTPRQCLQLIEKLKTKLEQVDIGIRQLGEPSGRGHACGSDRPKHSIAA
jgi:hypothetical protein